MARNSSPNFARAPRTLTCFGLGGKEMEAAGLDRIVRAEDVAHMGITEVIRHMPAHLRQLPPPRRLHQKTPPRRRHPHRLPRRQLPPRPRLKKLNIPVIYFVSPQLWAWKRRRLRWVQQRVSRMMVIFPSKSASTAPAASTPSSSATRWPNCRRPPSPAKTMPPMHGLDPAKLWIALLPGSRWKEVTANLDTMVELTYRFPEGCNYILPVASTIDREKLAREITGHDEWLPTDTDAALKQLNIHLVPDAREALHHARASVVASGTATVQAAVIGNPFVVVYRVSPLTFWLAKRLVRYPPRSGPPRSTPTATCPSPW